MTSAPDIGEDWHAAIDLDRLATWMDNQGLPGGPVEEAALLAGGTQNILLRFLRGGRAFILRRPPSHLRANSNETMRREARVLKALADTPVPHPRLIAACEDETILGAAFYLMEPVDGFNITTEMSDALSGNAATRAQVGTSLVDAIAELSKVDHVAVGLGRFGRPDGFLERQVPRWQSQYASYAAVADWPGPDSLPDVDQVADWLERFRPPGFTPGIMHGDYHFANVLIDRHEPRIAAIVDWELATIGDPELDLAWLLTSWPDPDGRGGLFDIMPWEGFPTTEDIIERYRQVTGRALDYLKWHRVLAGFKFGILLEGTHARACAGEAPAATGDRLHGMAVAQLERASRLIDTR
jgi:aminoglycoside phosphotransferase (APT) family kinase protein